MKNMDVRIGVVSFTDNISCKQYHFLTDILDLQRGQDVVVDTQNGYKVATFERYIDTQVDTTYMTKGNTKIPMKWIVQKVDAEAFVDRITKLQQALKLKRQMKEHYERTINEKAFETLALTDSHMADMLIKYNELMGN